MVGAESDSFRSFVVGSQARVVRFAELLTGDRQHAEDLAQEAYAKAYASWPRLRDGQPEAYVRRCILNARTDWWRRGRWREQPTCVLADRQAPRDEAAAVAQRALVMAALASLTVKERSVVVLRYYAGLSEAEIARELHCRVGTVKSTAARALGKLRADATLREGVT